MTPPRGPVFVSLPVDVMSTETLVLAANNKGQLIPPSADLDQIKGLADRLSNANAAIIAGDDVTVYDGFDSLTKKIAKITGATVFRKEYEFTTIFLANTQTTRVVCLFTLLLFETCYHLLIWCC